MEIFLWWEAKLMSLLDRSSDEITHRSPAEILTHALFSSARIVFVNAVLDLYEDDPFLTRLLSEAGRHVIFSVIMCLYACYREADRPTWPTMSGLKKAMIQFGLSSSRRVEALAARLVHSGFLELVPSKRDGRVRILTPTQRMLAHDRNWLTAHYLPLQMLFPDPGYAPIIEGDRSFQFAQRVVSMDFFGHGAHILSSNPGIMLFLGRDAGVMILIKLVQLAHVAGNDAIEGVSYKDIGERFGVSRTHVRDVLLDAERAGFVRLTGRGGHLVQLTPAVMLVFDRFIADSMSGNDLMYQLAVRRMARQPQTLYT
jgi:hypothetical protein